MTDTDTAENPKSIISLMFGVSVGFWASELAKYLTIGIEQVDRHGVQLEKLFFTGDVKSWIVLASGLLFLLDLLCIVWWYARYIYRIQPRASFGTYFLDFVICSMFALAANTWTDPKRFLMATVAGSGFLVLRFYQLYRGSSASLTDRSILRLAGALLVGAVVLGVLAVALLQGDWIEGHLQDDQLNIFDWTGPATPGILSLIGIGLTFFLRSKIDVAVDIYSAVHASLDPTPLYWPKSGLPDSDQRMRIRQETDAGLEQFDALFRQLGRHEHIRSRVHSETDLRVQSYILALPSCEREEYTDEIKAKTFMVAVSHWLDDLVDGRSEVAVWKRLRSGPPLSDEAETSEELFQHIYRPLIVKHTSRGFYKYIDGAVRNCCLFPFNRKYMFLALNRIAYGAVMFSPKIDEDRRKEILDSHNIFLKVWNVEGTPLSDEVEAILDAMAGAGDAGSILLGLTTKTVQELAMSSENYELNVSLSILFSILYAPLVYYHNIRQELLTSEMVSLQAFDTDYDLWIPWIKRAREAIDLLQGEDRSKARIEARLSQISMAYQCFKSMLPEPIDEELRKFCLIESDPNTA